MIWLHTIIAVLLIIALVVITSLARGNSAEKCARQANTAKLRQRVRQIEELIQSWRRISNHHAPVHELYQVALEILDRISALDPGHAFAASEQQRLLPLIENLATQSEPQACDTAMASTVEAGRMRNELKEIKRILHSRANGGLLSAERYRQYCEEIDWLGTQITLDTCLSLATESLNQNQPKRAEKLLQKALSTIKAADITDPRIGSYFETTTALMHKLPRQATARAY